MDQNAVLAKTAKGLEEVKSRTHGLSQKLRSLLITVDGIATAGELVAKFGGDIEIGARLQSLIDQGFVEAKAPLGAFVAPLPGAPSQTREQALAALSRMLHESLGPDGDLVVGVLERARTRAEFVAAAERCAELLSALGSSTKAQQFRERMKSYIDLYFGAA